MQQREQRQEAERPVYEALREEAPGQTFLGEMSPWVLSPLGPTAGARRKLAAHQAAGAEARLLGYEAPQMGRLEAAKTHALASPVVTGAVEGGVVGAIHPEMDATTGAGFGAAGGWGGKLLGRAFSSPYKNPSHTSRRILEWADQHDLFTPPGLATGRTTLQQLDAATATHPKTADLYQRKLRESAYNMNRMITDKLTSVGPGGKIQRHGVREITPDWIDHHMDRVGEEMDTLVSATRADVAKSASQASDHLAMAQKNTNDKILPITREAIDELEDLYLSQKVLDGKTYQRITRDIKKGINKLSRSGDVDAAAELRKIIDDIHDDIELSGLADPGVIPRWKKARKDYALLSGIEEARAKNRHNSLKSGEGFIDYKYLGNKFKNMDPDFDMLSQYADIMGRQSKSSLSTSSEFAKTFNPFSTDVRAGPALRLGGKTLNKIPFVGDELNNLATSVYLSGYPYKRGVLGFDSPLARQGIESLLTRLGIGSGEKE
jgi:hypothetical protein